MDTIKIGSFIMELRKKKNMTQKELADKFRHNRPCYFEMGKWKGIT